ncbi:MAG: hypothetical protein JXX28_19800 [Deltaproteobacteria bacterium]|nr:hypothetical protein [Deltaproteobacteria bacterium]
MIWMLLALAEPSALALEPELAVAVRALGETWPDAAMGSTYRTGAVMGGVGLIVDVLPWVSADLEVAYRRLDPRLEDQDARMELVPLSLVAEASTRTERGVQAFAGMGPALVLFSEYNADGHADPALPTSEDAMTVLSGGRLGWELRTGIRVDTGLIQPPSAPAPGGVFRAAELEITAARRMQRPGREEGLRLSAWRVGLGLVFRL